MSHVRNFLRKGLRNGWCKKLRKMLHVLRKLRKSLRIYVSQKKKK